MFQRLGQRGERLAARRAAACRERIAATLDAAVPGTAAVEGEAVVLSGPGLTRRYDASADLRWRIAEACNEQ